MNIKIKKIFTLSKALELKKLGNDIIFTEPNYKNKKLKVFIFEYTEKFKQDWKNINI